MARIPVDVLLLGPLLEENLATLEEAVQVLDGRDPAKRDALVASHRDSIRAISTTAHVGASRTLIESLPKLELIACSSAGLDYIDVDAAAEHGVAVTNTSDALFNDVADVAIAHCLLLLRKFAVADRYVREGKWKGGAFPLGQSLKGKRMGILGLGTIGQAIAQRAEVMGMSIAYTSRKQRPGSSYSYYPTLVELAENSDILVVCCPATKETYHIVDAAVLRALGSKGYVVNIARGSVIDEPALIEALKTDVIAGAGLDVFETEPDLSPEFLPLENVSLSPHVGSATKDTRLAMGQMMIDSIVSRFGGRD